MGDLWEGAGQVPQKGSFRFSFNVVRGTDSQGGHPETKGLDENGQVITVPAHSHEVSLDFLRVELEFQYTFLDHWDFVVRAPYDIKDQSSAVGFVDPATPEEKAAMLRNMEIHHRGETYRGFSDLMALVAFRDYDLLRQGDSLRIAFGTSLPVGQTEDDPFKLGDEGEEHLHIQFGTGTFDPLLELYYQLPLAGKLSLGAYTLGRFPFYENNKTYQGAVEATAGVSLAYLFGKRFFLHGDGTFFYQGHAQWDGQDDINSGLRATSALVGLSVNVSENTTLGIDFLYPISQSTLASEGDTFERGNTFLFRISRSFP